MATSNELVEETILSQIAAGELRPGSRLVHRKIARELGVSTIPVVQALRKLEGMGMLRRHLDGGTRVRDWGEGELRCVYLLREVLDGTAARICAERATEEDLAVLRVRLEAMERRLRADEDRLSEEKAFHRGIVDFCHMPLLLHFYDNLSAIHWTFVGEPFLGFPSRDARELAGLHDATLDAIVARDASAAEEHARYHVREAFDLLWARIRAKESQEAVAEGANVAGSAEG